MQIHTKCKDEHEGHQIVNNCHDMVFMVQQQPFKITQGTWFTPAVFWKLIE